MADNKDESSKIVFEVVNPLISGEGNDERGSAAIKRLRPNAKLREFDIKGARKRKQLMVNEIEDLNSVLGPNDLQIERPYTSFVDFVERISRYHCVYAPPLESSDSDVTKLEKDKSSEPQEDPGAKSRAERMNLLWKDVIRLRMSDAGSSGLDSVGEDGSTTAVTGTFLDENFPSRVLSSKHERLRPSIRKTEAEAPLIPIFEKIPGLTSCTPLEAASFFSLIYSSYEADRLNALRPPPSRPTHIPSQPQQQTSSVGPPRNALPPPRTVNRPTHHPHPPPQFPTHGRFPGQQQIFPGSVPPIHPGAYPMGMPAMQGMSGMAGIQGMPSMSNMSGMPGMSGIQGMQHMQHMQQMQQHMQQPNRMGQFMAPPYAAPNMGGDQQAAYLQQMQQQFQGGGFPGGSSHQ